MEYYHHITPADNTRLPGMNTLMADMTERHKVMYIPNVPYVERLEETLHLQLLMPDGLFPGLSNGKKYPLVVFVQGAAWGEQDMYHNLPQLCRIAQEGFVVASVKHRSNLVAHFPAFLQDVKSAIRFLRFHAADYSIDPDRVAVWGDSSGGNAALLVGVTGDMEQFKTDDNRTYSDAVKAVVDFYGPTDVTAFNRFPRDPSFLAEKGKNPEDLVLGTCVEDHPEAAVPLNPASYVTADSELPPFLIMHGDRDALVPFNQSVMMVKALQDCGKSVEFYKVCNAGHGFFLWNDSVLKTVVQFLKAYVGI